MGSMDRSRRARPSPAMVVAFVALVLAMGGGGYAAFAAPAKKTGAKFYAPSDYLPGDSNVDYGAVGIGQRFCGSSPDISGTAEFRAAFDNLPDGARITKVTAFYSDLDADEQLSFQVGSHTPGVSDALEEFAEATSSNGTGDLQSVEMTPTSPVAVDNANRRYFVAATFSACGTTTGTPGVDEFPTLILDGVRVDYTLK